MTPERATNLYRRLRYLFPARWRSVHEHELVETLQDSARAGEGPGVVVQSIDLLMLAAVLRRRELVDRFVGVRERSDLPRGALPGHVAGGFELGPAAGVLAFALVLLVPVLLWGGEVPAEFVLTTSLVVAIPGIGVLYTVSCALAGGRARGLIAAIGCTLGIVPHLIVAFLGLSGLMQLGATLFEAVRWAGVLYLAWMGVTMLRPGGASREDDESVASRESVGSDAADGANGADEVNSTTTGDGVHGAAGVIVRGVLLNVLNPKLTLFFFAFLPQFLVVAPGGGVTAIDPRLIGLGSLFMLLTLGGFVLYALAGAAARDWAARAPRGLEWARRSIGVLLLGFAARLAIAER